MSDLGRILIADDEEIFLISTADLLREQGYECICVPDGQEALAKLTSEEFDLLIADIKMSGNEELELIHQVQRIAKNLPVILVTGYPSLESAIQSVQLPVVAYMRKPINFQQLLTQVQVSVNSHRVNHAVHALQKRLKDWREGLVNIEETLNEVPKLNTATPIGTFFDITCQNIAGALLDLNHLAKALTIPQSGQELCHLLNCPRLNVLTTALSDTIRVLKKTKDAFKSTELRELREKLEKLLADKTNEEQ
ncbi:response regulator [bacterium]|nr:response regulator [bacterium]